MDSSFRTPSGSDPKSSGTPPYNTCKARPNKLDWQCYASPQACTCIRHSETTTKQPNYTQVGWMYHTRCSDIHADRRSRMPGDNYGQKKVGRSHLLPHLTTLFCKPCSNAYSHQISTTIKTPRVHRPALSRAHQYVSLSRPPQPQWGIRQLHRHIENSVMQTQLQAALPLNMLIPAQYHNTDSPKVVCQNIVHTKNPTQN